MAQPKRGRGAARALGLLIGLLLPVGVLVYLGGTHYIAWSEHSLMASRFRVLAGFAAYLTEIADANRQAFAQTGVCPPQMAWSLSFVPSGTLSTSSPTGCGSWNRRAPDSCAPA